MEQLYEVAFEVRAEREQAGLEELRRAVSPICVRWGKRATLRILDMGMHKSEQ